jgi:hypothetical protein
MTPRHRTTLAATVVALAAFSLTAAGCGSSSPDKPKPRSFADQDGRTIVAAAFADTLGVTEMRIRGTVKQQGKDLKIDVRTDPAGRCAGTMSQGTGTARIVVTEDAAFIKGDRAFWRNAIGTDADKFLATLNGRWVKSKPEPQISDLCGLGQGMVKEMDKSISHDKSSIHVGEVSKIDGFDVVEVNDGGDHPAASLLISVDAPHYIRQVVSRTGPDQGVLTLSGFGDTAPVKVPAAGDVFETE